LPSEPERENPAEPSLAQDRARDEEIESQPATAFDVLSTDLEQFTAFYDALTPEQREVERERRVRALEAEPANEDLSNELHHWNFWVHVWEFEQIRARFEQQHARWERESRPVLDTMTAIADCSYLGGFPECPQPVEMCACCCQLGSEGFMDCSEYGASESFWRADWLDVKALRVLPADVTGAITTLSAERVNA
jgi:hypothetical protein